MKIVLEEHDLKTIERINNDYKENPDALVGWAQDMNRTYDLTITVTDVGKANNFLYHLMTRSDDRKEIESNIGMKLNSINYITKENMIKNLKEQVDSFFSNLI